MKILLRTATITLALFGAISGTQAATDSTSFNVKLTVTSTCDISTVPATDIEFGSHSSTSTNLDTTGALTVNCTNGTPYTIGLNDGIHDSSGVRRMAGQDANNTGVYVPYQLYTDSGRTAVWNSDTSTYGGTGSGSNQAVTIYARVASANFTAGDYLDTVTATITY